MHQSIVSASYVNPFFALLNIDCQTAVYIHVQFNVYNSTVIVESLFFAIHNHMTDSFILLLFFSFAFAPTKVMR